MNCSGLIKSGLFDCFHDVFGEMSVLPFDKWVRNNGVVGLDENLMFSSVFFNLFLRSFGFSLFVEFFLEWFKFLILKIDILESDVHFFVWVVVIVVGSVATVSSEATASIVTSEASSVIIIIVGRSVIASSVVIA